MIPRRTHLVQDDHSIFCRCRPGDGEGGSWQRDVGQAPLPDAAAVIRDLKGAALVVVQPASFRQETHVTLGIKTIEQPARREGPEAQDVFLFQLISRTTATAAAEKRGFMATNASLVNKSTT